MWKFLISSFLFSFPWRFSDSFTCSYPFATSILLIIAAWINYKFFKGPTIKIFSKPRNFDGYCFLIFLVILHIEHKSYKLTWFRVCSHSLVNLIETNSLEWSQIIILKSWQLSHLIPSKLKSSAKWPT